MSRRRSHGERHPDASDLLVAASLLIGHAEEIQRIAVRLGLGVADDRIAVAEITQDLHRLRRLIHEGDPERTPTPADVSTRQTVPSPKAIRPPRVPTIPSLPAPPSARGQDDDEPPTLPRNPKI